MTILLPPAGTNINTFVGGLTAAGWQQATANLTASELELFLPKFRLAWEDTLNDELQDLGMRQAFIGDVARFTRLSRSVGDHLYISFVKQKAFVDVNEVGTEAAAVTAVGVEATSLPPSVRVDRPFVFAIRERLSGTVLFMGKIIEPKIAS
jgi:serpin B